MTRLDHTFVELVPDVLDEGVLYVCIRCGTVAHRCCCGCGREVVTPLTPTDWKLIFDGETVSLYPSVGNWDFPCRSHYWIRHNRIEWAENWFNPKNRKALGEDSVPQAKHYSFAKPAESSEVSGSDTKFDKKGLWARLRRRWTEIPIDFFLFALNRIEVGEQCAQPDHVASLTPLSMRNRGVSEFGQSGVTL